MTIEEILERGEDADDVLRAVVASLHEQTGGWVGLAFVEEGRLELGPTAGGEPPGEPRREAVQWRGSRIAELQADARADPALLARVAPLLAPYCLVGWDTHGEPWQP